MEEKYPGRRLEVVDTLCASLGEGLLVWLVDDQRKSGASLDQARDYALALRKRIVHAFTVDDLNFLRRGGRLSGAAAVLVAWPQAPMALLCALCSFGGLSIWLQNLMFVDRCVRPVKLLMMRMLHGALSGGLALLIFTLFPGLTRPF